MAEGYQETDLFSLDLHHFSELMGDMAYEGKWRPLFDYLADRMQQSLSLRDLISGEKSIQTFLNVYLGLSNLYIVYGKGVKQGQCRYSDGTLPGSL